MNKKQLAILIGCLGVLIVGIGLSIAQNKDIGNSGYPAPSSVPTPSKMNLPPSVISGSTVSQSNAQPIPKPQPVPVPPSLKETSLSQVQLTPNLPFIGYLLKYIALGNIVEVQS